jgi:hypothetical protein
MTVPTSTMLTAEPNCSICCLSTETIFCPFVVNLSSSYPDDQNKSITGRFFALMAQAHRDMFFAVTAKTSPSRDVFLS